MKNLNDYVGEVEDLIDYEFDNRDLLFQAFTRKSYAHENGGLDNEELEFIGDKVLDFIVIKILTDVYGYQKHDLDEFDEEEEDDEFFFEGYDEGSLTVLKSKLVNKSMLAHRIDVLGFKDYLFMGKGDIKDHKENEESVKEDLFEAILGAIAVDSEWDIDALEDSVRAMLDIDSYLDDGLEEDNYVELIQQWNQKENDEIPEYSYKKYDNYFLASLKLNTQRGIIVYKGRGTSKSDARDEAAEEAYRDLEENDELWTILDELPDEITLENSINILQELAQKGYQEYPVYEFDDESVYDENGNMLWECTCSVEVNDEEISWTATASTKKEAKKIAAYSVICQEFNFENEYANNSEDDDDDIYDD